MATKGILFGPIIYFYFLLYPFYRFIFLKNKFSLTSHFQCIILLL